MKTFEKIVTLVVTILLVIVIIGMVSTLFGEVDGALNEYLNSGNDVTSPLVEGVELISEIEF